MSESIELALRQAEEELRALYEGAGEGILVVDARTRQFVRANRALCTLLGYSEEELLSLSVRDVHPPESVSRAIEAFEAVCDRRLDCVRNLPCRRKDGSVVYVDITVYCLDNRESPCTIGFFHDVTEQNRTIELLRGSEERHRLIANHVGDVIWTAPLTLSGAKLIATTDIGALVDDVLERWRFSYVSPSVTHVFGYTPEEALQKSLRGLCSAESYARVREAVVTEFMRHVSGTEGSFQQHTLEMEMFAKDGSSRWCEVVSTYLRNGNELPTAMLGITRDISQRRQAEQALRDSESKLRSLFDNLPDLVITIGRDSRILFANRGLSGISQELMIGRCVFDFAAPESLELSRRALDEALTAGRLQTVEVLDVFGCWWTVRLVPVGKTGDVDHVMVICTDITQQRLAMQAVEKEQRLLRRLLELHERERRLTAYEIHDGFAQQLVGALFRLQGFREMHSRDPAKAWDGLDSAVRLISRAIDETRRLISGLRPPILDESGIVEAIAYLACEHRGQDGPKIEFAPDVAFDRLAPPLETAIFRIVQESLQNACRHSHSDKIRIELRQRGDRIFIDIWDWGVGFNPEVVEEQRFGLQGIRERVRLLDGRATIESAPGQGTHIAVELPLVDATFTGGTQS
jgi:PAS domain S-box-containing protein